MKSKFLLVLCRLGMLDPLSAHCTAIHPLASWHAAILLCKYGVGIYSSPPCTAHWSNLAFPYDAIWVFHWARNLSSGTWQNMTNMRHRVIRLCQQNTNSHIHKYTPICVCVFVCVSGNTCCDCMLLFFLLTSPEEMIMRQNEKEIKTFHEMITFQCFSKHFENAFQYWCYTYPPAWSNPLLKPA